MDALLLQTIQHLQTVFVNFSVNKLKHTTMSETLLVTIISIVFGGIVYLGSKYYEKKTGANITPWIWGLVSCALVWAIWFFTDDFLDIGSK